MENKRAIKKPRWLTPERQEIANAYVAGESMASIRDRTGRSPNYIWLALKKAGVERRPGDWWMIQPAERQALIDAYKNGETMKSIAKRTGRDRMNISRILAAAGVDVIGLSGLSRSKAHRTHTLNESYFASVDTERKAWLLGFIAADGNVHIGKQKAHNLAIGLAWKDVGILETIRAEFEYTGTVRRVRMKYKGEDYFMAMLQISSVQLVRDLIALGIVPNKSLILKPWHGPLDLMPHYWRGVIDGDGCWSKAIQFNLVGSKDMIDGFCAYCLTILSVKINPKLKKNKTWQVSCGRKNDLVKLAAHFYPPSTTIALPRKWEIAKRIIAKANKTPSMFS